MNVDLMDTMQSLNSPALVILNEMARWKESSNFFRRIRAMLNSAGVKDQLRSGVRAECAMKMTFLLNVTSIKNKNICPYELLFGCKPKLPTSLRSFGEIGVVTTIANI
jgi:hypothetical protein